MKKGRRCVFIFGLLILAGSTTLPSQDGLRRPSVLPESYLKLIANEINGYAAFNNLRIISTYHRTLGSDQISELLSRLKEKCILYGIKDVTIHKTPIRTGYEYFFLQNFDGQVPTRTRSAEVRLVKPYPKLITSTESAPSCLIQGSRAANLTAPVVYIGPGNDPKNYEGKDLKGKIALAGDALPNDIKELAIHKYGAAGVLCYLDIPHNSGDNDDANLNFYWSPWSKSGEESTFGISLSRNQFRLLKGLLDRGEEVIVKIRVDTELKKGDDAVFETLDASIPGTEYPEEEFWVWAHIDHSMPGAVDNASGCAVALEMARTLQSLADNGLIPKPKRTIRFLWLPHVAGLSMYLSEHPEKLGKIRGGISLDSVGIDQSYFSSYFAPCKPSHSLPSYWTAVLESLVEHLDHRTNRDLLDYGNTDNLFSPEGRRDQFNVRLLPFNAFGDEMQVNNNTIGIPTIAFGCLPVPPRHSQVNFIKYVDPTGLHRVAYLGTALALVFSSADAGNVWRITDEVYERGRMHLIREYQKAEKALSASSRDHLASVFKRASLLLRFGGERELGMLASIERLVPTDTKPLKRIALRKNQTQDFCESLKNQLHDEYRMRCAELECQPVMLSLTQEEEKLDRIIPVPVPGVMGTSCYFGDYYEKTLGKEKLDSYNLDPAFSYGIVGYTEAHNFIDGNRSILEIFQATTAELWSEGYPSSHDITLTEVKNYMKMLEAAHVITFKTRD
jgi:hypothetical protein